VHERAAREEVAVGRTVNVERAEEGSVQPRIASRKVSGLKIRVASENVEDGRIERPRAQDRSLVGDQVGQALDDEEDDPLLKADTFATGRSFFVFVVAIVDDELCQALLVHLHQMAIDFLQNDDVLKHKLETRSKLRSL